MNYDGLIIRPPSEADSLILQVTVGCSHNQCTFCPAYKEKTFRIKPEQEIFKDIDQASKKYAGAVRRVFLCDGDPLIMPYDRLLSIIEHINLKFPRLQRIGIYGNAKSILRKTPDELAKLKKLKLGIVYLGLESGDREVLESVKKGVTPEQTIKAALKVKQAGMKLNVTVLLGLGGKSRSRQHAAATIHALNQMKPNHVGALTLMLVPRTLLHEASERGEFTLPDKFGLIEELRIMIAGSELTNCLFFSNHASNYLPIQARLPKDKESILHDLDFVLSSRDERNLRSEFVRAL